MAEIRIKNLTKTFGKFTAIDNLTLTMGDREFVSLLGPSGCGKTTTLRILSGLEEPTAGEVFFDDQVMSSAETGAWIPPEKRGIGLVFQSYALWPHMTVWDNIDFGLEMQHLTREKRKRLIEDILTLLQIQELGKRYSYQLSGGQQQRVALARSLVLQPKVLLLDEPLSNLDARLRIEMRAELTRLHSQLQNTTIFVTHDQLEAMTLSTRIAVMKDGMLQQYAPPLDIYREPANLFVAKFVGSPPINVISRREHPKVFESISSCLKQAKLPSDEVMHVAFRPEFSSLASTQNTPAGNTWSIKAMITSIQPTGPEWIIQVDADELRMLINLNTQPKSLALGDTCTVSVHPEHFLMFGEDELLIPHRSA